MKTRNRSYISPAITPEDELNEDDLLFPDSQSTEATSVPESHSTSSQLKTPAKEKLVQDEDVFKEPQLPQKTPLDKTGGSAPANDVLEKVDLSKILFGKDAQKTSRNKRRRIRKKRQLGKIITVQRGDAETGEDDFIPLE